MENGGRQAVGAEEGAQLLASVFYFKYENAILNICNDPGKLLAGADGS